MCLPSALKPLWKNTLLPQFVFQAGDPRKNFFGEDLSHLLDLPDRKTLPLSTMEGEMGGGGGNGKLDLAEEEEGEGLGRWAPPPPPQGGNS